MTLTPPSHQWTAPLDSKPVRQQILNDTIENLDLINIFKILHPKKSEYTFFSSAYGTFSRIDHILGHKANLNKFKNTEIISSNFSENNVMKPKISHRKRNEKKLNTRRLNNMLLKPNHQWGNQEGNLKIPSDKWYWKHNH